MSSHSERETYSQAGDWLLGAVRRNPEALLLMAAGCCLMMRSGSSSSRSEWDAAAGRSSSQVRRAAANAREGFSRVTDAASDTTESAGDYASQVKDRLTEKASGYASQMKGRIGDTASSYADSAMDFADDARRAAMEHSARLKRQTQATLQSSMQRVLREQPLAVAVAGLAAGAAIAALFPSTEIEERALGGVHEKLKDAAEKAGEKVRDAAGKAGERLKSAAEERGLTSEGLKEVAGEVAGTFKDAMSGESENLSGASQTGGGPASGSRQSFGMEQNKQGNPSTTTTQPPLGGRSTR
jgi:hypothetical protein